MTLAPAWIRSRRSHMHSNQWTRHHFLAATIACPAAPLESLDLSFPLSLSLFLHVSPYLPPLRALPLLATLDARHLLLLFPHLFPYCFLFGLVCFAIRWQM